MALTPRLDLRQSQSLVMTPQLQQAIKLLQLSNLELTDYVEQQLEQNPLLERDETGGDGAPSTMTDEPTGQEIRSDEGVQSVDLAVSDDSGTVSESAMDLAYDDTFEGDGPIAGVGDYGASGGAADRKGQGSGGDGEANIENTLSDTPNLREHLSAQLAVDITDPVDRMIAHQFIDLLDDTGYLTVDLQQIADMLGCSLDRVEDVLACLQDFDPPGIFARNLAECLKLQLRERGRLSAPMRTLLDHLDVLGRRDLPALARICDVDLGTLGAMIAEIRSLDPKPALAFDQSVAQPVTPDILMRPQPNGGWIVELNTETLPRVLVNNQYYARVSGVAMSRKDKHYINECMHSANWLVKSLHQRATTILRVATEIIRQQDAFFVKGVQALKPLVLRDVAEAVELHESTISRVTSNKFMATPRGIYELKYFFSQAIAGANGGEACSAEWVRHRVKAVIESERPDRVLSDDMIVDVLRGEGIDIARRTVAKYREALGLPSSVQRRREKLARV
ncbi:MAG: RNA polymerase factor sigma-54 [Rhodospirillales bacterium]|nr:RNA polymerase factor sigma-54 [Rhodospirillales bacterium]